MKRKFRYILTTMAMVATLSLASCADDKNVLSPETLPETLPEAEAFQSGEFTFTVKGDWTLSSDQEWLTLQLKSDAQEMETSQFLSGKAGTFTVLYSLGDEDLDEQAQEGVLTLKVKGYEPLRTTIERKGLTYPTLPDNLTNLEPGAEGEFSFMAYTDWVLSAQNDWMKFQLKDKEEEPVRVLKGGKGVQTVTYFVDKAYHTFEEVSTSTISYESYLPRYKRITVEVSRGAIERQMDIFQILYEEMGDVYQPTTAFQMAFDPSNETFRTNYAIRSNFNWSLTNIPDWIKLATRSRTGEANHELEEDWELQTYYFDLDLSKATKEDMVNGKLTFKDTYEMENHPEDAKFEKEVTVSCPGIDKWAYVTNMSNREITISGDGKFPNTMNPDEPSADVLNLKTLSGITDNDGWPEGVKFMIIAKSKGFSGDFFYGVESSNPMMPGMKYDAIEELWWYGVDANTDIEPLKENPLIGIGDYALWASPTSESRYATLLALPWKVAQEITDIENQMFDESFTQINDKYKQYVVGEITQEAASGLKFADPMLAPYIQGISIREMDMMEKMNAGVQDGYVITYDSFESFSYAPLSLGLEDRKSVV